MPVPIDEIEKVGRLLAASNAIDAQLAALMGRPMTAGHPGEWLAARIFGIDLDGPFSVGSVAAGR